MNSDTPSSDSTTDSPQKHTAESLGAEPVSVSIPSPDHPTDLTYHPPSDTFRMEYDPEVNAPSHATVQVVAALEDCSPFELKPLFSALDPDALDLFFASTSQRPDHSDATVTFDYHGYEVTLHSYGVIAIRSATRDSAGG